MTKSFAKIISLLLIIGLNWTGISLIAGTDAYFNDEEVSEGNGMAAGKLDFYLEGNGFHAYDLNQIQTQEERIKVINDGGNLDFRYSVLAAITDESGGFCGNLILSADLNGIGYYSGSLSGFNNISDIPAPLPAIPDEWDFQITGGSGEGTCEFDFVFQAYQKNMIYGNGFFDEERAGNAVSTETDCGPAEHVVINEAQVAGAGSCACTAANDEFVELYNPTNSEIDISGWKLQYKSNTGTTWSSKVGDGLPSNSKISPYGFFLLASKSYSGSVSPDYKHNANWGLSDSAGHVRIIDNSESEIDKVGYGASADSAEGGSPASVPVAQKSIERGLNGYDSDDNSADFIIKENPTPTNSAGDGMPEIAINEFLASGILYDDFIEIYNGSDAGLGAGWKIKIENESAGILVETEELPYLGTGGFEVVYTTAYFSMDVLLESGVITLYDNNSNEIDKISYYDADIADSSFARIKDGSPNWVDPIPTPGGTNATPKNLIIAGLEDLIEDDDGKLLLSPPSAINSTSAPIIPEPIPEPIANNTEDGDTTDIIIEEEAGESDGVNDVIDDDTDIDADDDAGDIDDGDNDTASNDSDDTDTGDYVDVAGNDDTTDDGDTVTDDNNSTVDDAETVDDGNTDAGDDDDVDTGDEATADDDTSDDAGVGDIGDGGEVKLETGDGDVDGGEPANE